MMYHPTLCVVSYNTSDASRTGNEVDGNVYIVRACRIESCLPLAVNIQNR